MRYRLTCVASGLLILLGFIALGVHDADSPLATPPDAVITAGEPSTSGLPSTTRASTGAKRFTREPFSPPGTSPPVSEQPPVELPPPADETNPAPGACSTAPDLTVIAVEGCPVRGVVGAAIVNVQNGGTPPTAVPQSQKAAALPA